MDEETRQYLFTLGNPYAKLSVVTADETEVTPAHVARHDKKRSPKVAATIDAATQAYLFKLADPYAKLSVVPDEPLPQVSALIWKSKTEVYHYIAEVFALPQVVTRPPALLKQFASKACQLSPRAQQALFHRISARVPDAPTAHNRLSPKELDQLLVSLVAMAEDAVAVDGEAS